MNNPGDARGGQNRSDLRGDASGLNDGGCVVNHGVDSRDLLKDGEANSNGQRRADSGGQQIEKCPRSFAWEIVS